MYELMRENTTGMTHKGSLREGVRKVRKWEELQEECGAADVGKGVCVLS